MFWLQVAGWVALAAGIVLIFMGLLEHPRAEPFEPFEPYKQYEVNSFAERKRWDYEDEELEELERKPRTEFGGVVMIGPIPIVFGNNSRAATLAIVLTIFLMLMTFLLFFFPCWIR